MVKIASGSPDRVSFANAGFRQRKDRLLQRNRLAFVVHLFADRTAAGLCGAPIEGEILNDVCRYPRHVILSGPQFFA